MHFDRASRTQTSDSGNESSLTVTHNEFGTRVGQSQIYLRHRIDKTFFGTRGQWVARRSDALRFATNLDAILYSDLLKLDGRIVAIDEAGRDLYELDVAIILEKVSPSSITPI